MICPTVDQLPLAALVYAWAVLLLCTWSWRHASAGGMTGRALMVLAAIFWPVTVLLLVRRSP
jgi:uncharacterized membrane protein